MSVSAVARATRASRENSGGLFTSRDPHRRWVPNSLTEQARRGRSIRNAVEDGPQDGAEIS